MDYETLRYEQDGHVAVSPTTAPSSATRSAAR